MTTSMMIVLNHLGETNCDSASLEIDIHVARDTLCLIPAALVTSPEIFSISN